MPPSVCFSCQLLLRTPPENSRTSRTERESFHIGEKIFALAHSFQTIIYSIPYHEIEKTMKCLRVAQRNTYYSFGLYTEVLKAFTK